MTQPVPNNPPPPAPATMDLLSIQQHIRDLCAHHKWNENSPEKIFLLLTEEVGEVAKALRRLAARQSPQLHDELAEELVDCLMYLADIANHYNLDLESAYRDKTVKNATRVWTE
jgi:NTP pyrophosphatase (non-canonical NTP hydrolase)